MSPVAVLTFGFFLGLRHATDADHVVAVTTVASREGTPRGALRIGALWGLGHTATLFIAGGVLVFFGLGIPPRLAQGFELAVAVMLVVLGFANWRAGGQRPPSAAAHEAGASPRRTPLWRPLLVGTVHGLAGTGALTLLVLATIPRPALALLYLAVFGVGTLLGMVALSGALAVPVAMAMRRAALREHALVRFTGLASLIFGLALAYRIGFVDGLFLPPPSSTSPSAELVP